MKIRVPVGTAIFWMVVGVVAYAFVWPMVGGFLNMGRGQDTTS